MNFGMNGDYALSVAASSLARIAHAGQMYDGMSYFEGHLCEVANEVWEQARVDYLPVQCLVALAVAYLHDIVEDTECSELDLRRLIPDADVVNAVMLLTREKESKETYRQYVARVCECPLARLVKKCDLRCNKRANQPKDGRDPTDLQEYRLDKYHRALTQIAEYEAQLAKEAV